MLHKVLETIRNENLMEAGELVVAGVSGGADSICLLSALFELREVLGIRLAAVHVNHGIRGAEAAEDAEYVRSFCRERGIPCRVYERDVPAAARKEGLSEEEAGRQIRYACFAGAMEEWGSRVAAVAHNQNDQAETVLFHLFRGSGGRGIAGIPVKGPLPGSRQGSDRESAGREGTEGGMRLVRPLLYVSRQEIEAYLRERQIPFRTDSTNESERYSRNRIRRRILPQAVLINQEAVSHIAQAAEWAAQMNSWLEAAARQWIQERCRREGNGPYLIPRGSLEELEPVLAGCVVRLLYERLTGSLKDFTKRHTDSVLGLLKGQPGRRLTLPGGVTAFLDQKTLRLGREEPEAAGTEAAGTEEQRLIPETDWKYAELSGIRFAYRRGDRMPGEKNPQNSCAKWFDYDKIKTGLSLRTRRTGDYFQAFSDGRRQTVKACMINRKIPSGERGRIPVFADGSHVLWIVGVRDSEGFRVTEETRQVLEIRVVEHEKKD